MSTSHDQPRIGVGAGVPSIATVVPMTGIRTGKGNAVVLGVFLVLGVGHQNLTTPRISGEDLFWTLASPVAVATPGAGAEDTQACDIALRPGV